MSNPLAPTSFLQSSLYFGHVRHRRFFPRRHQFRYTLFMVYLDLAELDTAFNRRWLWSTRRPALAWFRREDPLPEQTGRLYQLRHDDGAQGFAVMIDALIESGALKFIGGWPSWDVVGDEPTYAHFRVGLRGPSALLPPGLESIL